MFAPQRSENKPSLLRTEKLIGRWANGRFRGLPRDRDRTCIALASKHICSKSEFGRLGISRLSEGIISMIVFKFSVGLGLPDEVNRIRQSSRCKALRCRKHVSSAGTAPGTWTKPPARQFGLPLRTTDPRWWRISLYAHKEMSSHQAPSAVVYGQPGSCIEKQVRCTAG